MNEYNSLRFEDFGKYLITYLKWRHVTMALHKMPPT